MGEWVMLWGRAGVALHPVPAHEVITCYMLACRLSVHILHLSHEHRAPFPAAGCLPRLRPLTHGRYRVRRGFREQVVRACASRWHLKGFCAHNDSFDFPWILGSQRALRSLQKIRSSRLGRKESRRDGLWREPDPKWCPRRCSACRSRAVVEAASQRPPPSEMLRRSPSQKVRRGRILSKR